MADKFELAAKYPSPMVQTENIAEVKEGLSRWSATAIGHLVRRGASPEEATEIVQDACITALEKRAQFKSGTNFRAWFFTILFSRRADFFNKKTRHSSRSKTLEVPDEIVGAVGVDWNKIETDEDIVRLRNCLQQENVFQEALKLRYFEQLSSKEISLRLDIPESTASTRVYRGIRKLKDCMGVRTPS